LLGGIALLKIPKLRKWNSTKYSTTLRLSEPKEVECVLPMRAIEEAVKKASGKEN
jgi:hypothetical protein